VVLPVHRQGEGDKEGAVSIQSLAEKASEKMAEGGVARAVALDPLTILAILSVIMEISNILRGCGLSPAEAGKLLRQPTLGAKLRLRRAMTMALKKHPGASSHRQEIREALLAVGSEMTDEEVSDLIMG
jgi:hypothetical protein